MTDYEDILEKIGDASVARKVSVEAGEFLEQIGVLYGEAYGSKYDELIPGQGATAFAPDNFVDDIHPKIRAYASAVIAKYTLQWAIKNVLFEQSSKNAIQEAIDELDKAWDARSGS